MRDYDVVCGGLRAGRGGNRARIALTTERTHGNGHQINLELGDVTRRMVEEIPARFTDVLEIAAYIYCADQFTRRDTPEMREFGADWRRSFRFGVPVRDVAFWKRADVREALTEAVSFLSDDSYDFRFSQAETVQPLQEYLALGADGPPTGFVPDRIALFSGGLDSFAGALDALIERGERVALVSHQSSPMVRSKQSHLTDALRQRTHPAQLFHVSVVANKGVSEATEFTQRSRSFLFAALGAVIARLFKKSEVVFYENGVVSLNLPFAEHVLGARATRTTHPRVLTAFAGLFSLIAEAEMRFVNPFFSMTKADVVRKIVSAGAADLISSTFSCTRTRQATQAGGQHCGICSQCVDRRFGILAADAGPYEPEDQYAVDLFTGPREPGPDVTLVESFVLTATKLATMSQAGFLSNYGQVYRALPFLAGDALENAAKLYDLHRRHGQDVVRVVDAALGRHSSLADTLALPDTCLLNMVRTQLAGQPAWFDDAEPGNNDPPRRQPPNLVRPIELALDDEHREAVFAGGVTIRGKGFDLLRELHKGYAEARDLRLPPEQCPYIPSPTLALRLRIADQTLRQRIRRTRRDLADGFQRCGAGTLQDDDVIQTAGWHGYRLNPYLVISPRAILEAKIRSERTERHNFSGECDNSPVDPADLAENPRA